MNKLLYFLMLSGCTVFAQSPVMTPTRPAENSRLSITAINATASSVQFIWNVLPGDYRYSVSYKINSNPEIVVGIIDSPSYIINGLQNGNTVVIKVDARDSIRGSIISDSSSFTVAGGVCATSVVPPTVLNGITITESFTGEVLLYPTPFSSCGNVITPANSKHIGSDGPFTYTMNFSQPVNNVVIALTATGHLANEEFMITTNTGVPLISTVTSCYTSVASNVITSGAGAPGGAGGGGGGIFTIVGSSNFNSIIISGPGGQNGSLLSVCSNSVIPVNCNVGAAPITSITSLGTICPGTTVDLNVISASNIPSFPGISLTWHTGFPATSTNQLTAAQVLQAPAGTTYYAAFYDSVNNCYSGTTTLTTFISPSITPAFTPIAPVCSGAVLGPLPTTSINGITGAWSPAIDNTATTTYTFQPAIGQCASVVTMTIVVNSIVTPSFTPISTICAGAVVSNLPTMSNNGIIGTWSPVLNNMMTTTYTFTPNSGQCAISTDLQIAVDQNPVVNITQQCNEFTYTLTANSDITENLSYEWYDASGAIIATTQTLTVEVEGVYKVIVTNNNCEGQSVYTVGSVYCGIPKGISPNGDGSNDWFDLSGLNVSHLQIYNRYGVLVYDKNNYLNEWGGKTDSGKELPDATYYYLIEFKNDQPKTGWVYVNREL